MKAEALDLVNIAEIANRLGVSRQTVHVWERTNPTFPDPDATIGRTRVWKWETIQEWRNG